MPGLIESHVHLNLQHMVGGYDTIELRDWQEIGAGVTRRTHPHGLSPKLCLGAYPLEALLLVEHPCRGMREKAPNIVVEPVQGSSASRTRVPKQSLVL